jgi:hypothetical protein
VTDSIKLPQYGSNYRYFEISVDLNLDGKKAAINISGPGNAVTVKRRGALSKQSHFDQRALSDYEHPG